MPEKDPITLSGLMKPHRTAVVTGASSGIGRAACLAFARAGMNVWMVDVDSEELKLAHELVVEVVEGSSQQQQSRQRQQQQTINAVLVDVSDAAAMQRLADRVFYDGDEATPGGGGCHVLFNNAGVGLGGGALTDMATVERVMAVNAYGPIHGCLAFVPKMKQSGEPGLIINTGSKQGITAPPGNLVYNMSKAALKVYTEGLEHELMLERIDGSGRLRAALLVPGWVNTSILLKAERAKAVARGDDAPYDPSQAFFHEEKPHPGAWMPGQVIDFLKDELDTGNRFYVICPDNDVDRETDNLRIAWTAQDILEDRPPLSRWHPEFKDKFAAYVHAAKEEK